MAKSIDPLLHTKDGQVIFILGLRKKIVQMSFTLRQILVNGKIGWSFTF